MDRKPILTESELEIIADILANCHNWYVEDLATEVNFVIGREMRSLDTKIGHKIVNQFFAIPTESRMSPQFDVMDFIKKSLSIEGTNLDA